MRPRFCHRFARGISSSVVVALLTTAVPAFAQAPTSDADKDAARTLFKEGFALQSAGHYADALDRFSRSEQVYPAPTALLHIAECQAELLRLVEAAETYRTLAREPLAAGAPPAFVAAQVQGAAELQQIEPRIPHVHVTVKPENLPGLAVNVDGAPMSVALLGVDRPIDPGEHKIDALAPGYAHIQVTLRADERTAPQPVAITLPPSGIPVVATPTAPPGFRAEPPVLYLPPPPPPPVSSRDVTPTTYAPDRPLGPPPSRQGLFFGARLGAVVPDGSGLSDTIKPGLDLGAELNFRFARRFFVGAVIDHGFLGTASAVTAASATAGTSSPTFSTTNIDATFGVITNPDHFAVLLQTGLGYRYLAGGTFSGPLTSPEFLLGAGLWIPIGESFRLVPRIDAAFGSLTGNDTTGGSLSYGYAMLTVVVGGYYNIDFH